ncbi:MAG: TrkA C-terminal domain-containing protein [Ilumatobacteraceae bacterium]
MYAVATFLVVAALTMTFTKLATGALIATGVPPDIAAFQARSAFSGAGFTTTEAENVINHPTRRKIIATTMFVGNLGTPTLVVTVLVGFLAGGPGSTTERTLVIGAGLLLIVLAITNRPVTRVLTGVGERYAQRRLLPVLERHVDELLALGDGYIVGARRIGEEPHDAQRSLRGLDEAFPGCTVLGVRQGDGYVGSSPVDIDLTAGDVLIVYGPRDLVEHPLER